MSAAVEFRKASMLLKYIALLFLTTNGGSRMLSDALCSPNDLRLHIRDVGVALKVDASRRSIRS